MRSVPVIKPFPLPESALCHTAVRIVRKLQDAGFEAYLVGGCVRDLVSGKRPKDFDITTSAHPEEVMNIFEHSIPVGAAFGVVTVVEDKNNFEVATFREERDYMDGRRPETLRYSKTPEEDVSRRDFTINALLYDVKRKSIIDHTGGLADLRCGVIRTIGEARRRFSEDYLRMLRAVRFATRFNFKLDAEAAEAIRELAGKLTLLSPERVRDELTMMLTGVNPEASFRQLSACGILRIVLPEIEALHGVEQPKKFHPEGDVFEHTMLLLRHLAYPSKEAGWAALLHDVGKPACQTFDADGTPHFYGHDDRGSQLAEKILKRLKMTTALTAHVTAAVRNHMRFASVQKMRPAKWRRLLADPNFPLELELHRLDCSACHGFLDNYLWLLDRMAELQKNDTPVLPPPLLTGHDLIELGIQPGPAMGKLLTRLRDLQLEGEISSRSEAVETLKKLKE